MSQTCCKICRDNAYSECNSYSLVNQGLELAQSDQLGRDLEAAALLELLSLLLLEQLFALVGEHDVRLLDGLLHFLRAETVVEDDRELRTVHVLSLEQFFLQISLELRPRDLPALNTPQYFQPYDGFFFSCDLPHVHT